MMFEQPTENTTHYAKGTLVEIPSGARLFIIDQDRFGYYLSDKPNGILRIGAIPENEVKPVNLFEVIRALRIAYFSAYNQTAKSNIDYALQQLIPDGIRLTLLRQGGCQCKTPMLTWLTGFGPKCDKCGEYVNLDIIEGEDNV